MSTFTVCGSLVKKAAEEHLYLANILNVFTLDTSLKIAVDKAERRVLESYREVAESSHHIASWLDLLGRVKGARAFEPIDIPTKQYERFELFVMVCANTVDEHNLLCATKQDYVRTSWRENKVLLFDRDEARERLKSELGKVCGGVVVMGDMFAGIEGSTIVNKSNVERSFNRVRQEASADVADALVKLAEVVAHSANKGAGAVLDAFNNELAKESPNKGELRSYWDSLVQLVPGISQMVDVVAKISKLFTVA